MGKKAGRKRASEHDMLEMRRAEVARLSYRGWEVERIAAKMGLASRTIYDDLAYVKKNADEVMRKYLVETVPHTINKALSRLDQVNKVAWALIEADGTADRDKISAGTLVSKTAKDIVDIITNNKTVVDRALTMEDEEEEDNNEYELSGNSTEQQATAEESK